MRLLLCSWALLHIIASGQDGLRIVEEARKQVGVTKGYDGGYVRLEYPGGDVPRETGVCTDVVIRAFRDALAKDLQKLVHEDMRLSFSNYPNKWGLKGPDRSIDHRRVPNLMTYFKRHHSSFVVGEKLEFSKFMAGDLVTCTVPPNLPHIMIVSDKRNGEGVPLVIHNIGSGAREEDRLQDFPITGHYRWKE